MGKSKIEWTEKTVNPTMGCNEVSEECTNCYAKLMAARLESMGQKDYEGTTRRLSSGKVVWTGKINFNIKKLEEAVKIKKPTVFFIDSMSDLFHPDIPFEFIWQCYVLMAEHPRHTFQILTKRPERRLEFYKWMAEEMKPFEGLRVQKHIWEGTSVGTQKALDERAPHIDELKSMFPELVVWLSMEPLLESVNLEKLLSPCGYYCDHNEESFGDWMEEHPDCNGEDHYFSNHHPDKSKIDWIVAGGESGHGARPMHPDWIRRIRDDCKTAGVPFLFKQWGSYRHFRARDGILVSSNKKTHYWEDGSISVPISKKKSGRLLDGVLHDEYPVRK
jgi:protein gp37